jgi:hypothetical protein
MRHDHAHNQSNNIPIARYKRGAEPPVFWFTVTPSDWPCRLTLVKAHIFVFDPI